MHACTRCNSAVDRASAACACRVRMCCKDYWGYNSAMPGRLTCSLALRALLYELYSSASAVRRAAMRVRGCVCAALVSYTASLDVGHATTFRALRVQAVKILPHEPSAQTRVASRAMGSAVRARQEKKNAKTTPARAQAPKKKIGPIETALLMGIPIVFGLCISYLFSRAAASTSGAETRHDT